MTPPAHGKPKACVIGWPVAHSRSPLIHRFWLDRLKIEGSYELATVAPAGFPAFVRDFVRQGFAGGKWHPGKYGLTTTHLFKVSIVTHSR